jgi:hypothetical protein
MKLENKVIGYGKCNDNISGYLTGGKIYEIYAFDNCKLQELMLNNEGDIRSFLSQDFQISDTKLENVAKLLKPCSTCGCERSDIEIGEGNKYYVCCYECENIAENPKLIKALNAWQNMEHASATSNKSKDKIDELIYDDMVDQRLEMIETINNLVVTVNKMALEKKETK